MQVTRQAAAPGSLDGAAEVSPARANNIFDKRSFSLLMLQVAQPLTTFACGSEGFYSNVHRAFKFLPVTLESDHGVGKRTATQATGLTTKHSCY